VIVNIRVGHRSARANSSMPFCNDDILVCISLLFVNIKARSGMTSRGTRRGVAIRCLALRWQVETVTRRQRDRSRVSRMSNSASSPVRGQRGIAPLTIADVPRPLIMSSRTASCSFLGPPVPHLPACRLALLLQPISKRLHQSHPVTPRISSVTAVTCHL